MSIAEAPEEVLASFVEELEDIVQSALREAATTRSSADLERIAGHLLLPWEDPEAPEEFVALLPAALEAHGDVAAASLLAAIAVLARPTMCRMADAARERLRQNGVRAAGTSSLGTLAVETIEWLDCDGDAVALVRLRRPGQRRLQIAFVRLAEDGDDAIIREAVLSEPERDGGHTLSQYGPPGLEVRRIETDELLARLRAAAAATAARELAVPLEVPFCLSVLSRALTGDAGAFTPLEVTLGHPLDVDPAADEEGCEALIDRLVRDFGEHLKADPATEEAVWEHGEFASCALLEWKAMYGDGRLGHWTLDDVREFLLDYVPRKLTVDEESIAMLPRCVGAFLGFLDATGALTGAPLDRLVAECAELGQPLARACADSGNWGMAKAMAMQMMQEGVAPSDEQALAAWIGDFNQRPRSERDATIGGARPEFTIGVGPPPGPAPAPRPPSAGRRQSKAKRRSARAARKANRRPR